ncbi:Rv0340 family IniB-related protein [Mycolicibacterium sp. CBM1]
MANSLLDFVMSLVRDPDAAARYAADPSGAIADAHLTNVTSADVNNLIPMVADSLSGPMSGVLPGFDSVDAGNSNVWASGAATAAFDAFDAHLPAASLSDAHPVITDVVTHAAADPAVITDPGTAPSATESTLPDSSEQLIDTLVDHAPALDSATDWAAHTTWEHADTDDSHGANDHQGFELF